VATAISARADSGVEPTRVDESATLTGRHLFAILGVLTVVGLALRLTYVFGAEHAIVSADGQWYHLGANYLADGKGFLNPYGYFVSGVTQPGATHAPGWTMVLGAGSLVGLRSWNAHAVLASCIGTATIPIIGLAGRRLAGPRVGVVAAVAATVYPNFWMYEAQLLSETLAIFGTALTILLALRFLDAPNARRLIGIGVACGLLTLVRAEMILLFFFLLIPIVLLVPRIPPRRRLVWFAAASASGFLVLAPWVGYNLSRYREPTYVTTGFGSTLLGGNCDAAYKSPSVGRWVSRCETPALRNLGLTGNFWLSSQLAARHMDDSTLDAEEAKLGVRYMKGHLSELPAVVLAREGRVWGVYQPTQQMRLDLVAGNINVLRAALYMYWALAVFAVIGVIALRRRWPYLVVLGASVAAVVVPVALTAGQTRLRAPADVAIVLVAAVGVDAVIRHRRGRPTPTR
jgi:4-amino-4-deoxy-L-arabinose transferase-like glycosyltransferase